jgi:hypothetical protein
MKRSTPAPPPVPFNVVVDPAAPPGDWLDPLADLLIRLARRKLAAPPATALARQPNRPRPGWPCNPP